MKKSSSALLLSTAILLSACSGLLPGSYRIDIPQGNLVTEEKINDVTVGMNRRQVQRVLGSPLLVDTFNQNRWDYFYSVDTTDGTNIEYHITIVFKNDVVNDIIRNDK
jgi:outer membrane protein assembly factor BamE